MGACASVPKGMRGEATAAPAPEPPKEASKNKMADVKNKKEENGVKKVQSLGKLLEEVETSELVPLEEASSSSESKAEQLVVSKTVATPTPKGEETAPVTPLPISEPAVPITPKVGETTTVIPPQARQPPGME